MCDLGSGMLTMLNVRIGDLRCGAAGGLPQRQKDAASAIATCAQVRFVRIPPVRHRLDFAHAANVSNARCYRSIPAGRRTAAVGRTCSTANVSNALWFSPTHAKRRIGRNGSTGR